MSSLAEKLWPEQNAFVGMFLVAEAVLREIERALDPKVSVVGVRAPGGSGPPVVALGRPAATVEKELAARVGTLMSGVEDGARHDAVRVALRDAINEADAQDGAATFRGFVRRVAGYDLTPVVRVNRSAFEAAPRLARPRIGDNLYAPRSFLEAVGEALVGDASNELARAKPGEVTTWVPRDFEALRRRAGSAFLDRVAVTGGNESAVGGLLERLSAVAALPYEGRSPRGTIVLARRDHLALRRHVVFEDGISLRDARAARKVLQMSSKDSLIWCAGEILIGLAHYERRYDGATEDLFEVRFAGRSKWDLLHAERALLQVVSGVPGLPRPPLSLEAFAGAVRQRMLGAEIEHLWTVVDRARHQGHGTMVVVSPKADAEALRLRSQAVRLAPARLEEGAILGLTEIDGALLLDQHGACHAAGLILDGHASARGTNARGARYNSAVRYTDEHPEALAVVVSEDGDIEIIDSDTPRKP